MWLEIKRKIFHLYGLIYVIGLIHIPRATYVAILAALLLADLLFETARLKNPRLNQWFIGFFGDLLRENEHEKISGAFWMVFGVLVTAIFVEPSPLAVTILLYLIFGDGVASLIGKRFRGPHWGRSDKRMSGSLGCFAACLVVGAILLRTDYGWAAVVGGAFVATVFEMGFVPLNDNFVIPAASTLFFVLYLGPFALPW